MLRSFQRNINLSFKLNNKFSSSSFSSPFLSSSSLFPFYFKRSLTFSTKNNLSNNLANEIKNENNNQFKDIPGVKTEGEKYAMVYTCKVCNTRSIKQISKQGYHYGCVLVRCPGCSNLHLIADNLGIFEDKGWNVEKYLSENGENVKKVVNDGVLELTRDDILGSVLSTSTSAQENSNSSNSNNNVSENKNN